MLGVLRELIQAWSACILNVKKMATPLGLVRRPLGAQHG